MENLDVGRSAHQVVQINHLAGGSLDELSSEPSFQEDA